MLGKSFGTHEIIDLLGQGGMGDVYRARGGSLDRDVAIKVLPSEFTADTERLQRGPIPVEEEDQLQLHFVTNWTSLLE